MDSEDTISKAPIEFVDKQRKSPDTIPVIPGYTLKEKIGSGGMSNIYSAVRDRNEQEVALKILKPEEATDQERINALKEEAKLTANLEHHHILPIIDLVNIPIEGSDKSGVAIVMKEIHGQTLKDLMEKQEITEEEADRYLDEMAEAVDFINNKGILHRDIKPSNILIQNSDDPNLRNDRSIVISDFGLAGKERPENIKDYALIGSPKYLSIEQMDNAEVSGDRETLQIGIIAFELYMGKHLIDTEFSENGQELKTSIDVAIFMFGLDGLKPVAREKVIEKYGENVANVFEKIFKREKEDRYQTAKDFVNALKEAKAKDREAKKEN